MSVELPSIDKAFQSATNLVASYTIDVPDPKSPRFVDVRIVFEKPWADHKLSLALAGTAAPELGLTFEYYNITEDTVHATIGGHTVRVKVRDYYQGDTYQFIDLEIPTGCEQGEVEICYRLDTRRADHLPARSIGQLYKDRVVVNDEYATIRGDAMFFPVTGMIEGPPNPGIPIQCKFRVSIPSQWSLAINAETFEEENYTAFDFEFDGHHVFRGFRWFALAGELIGETIAGPVTHVLVTPKWCLSDHPDRLDPAEALQLMRQIIAYYDRTFGMNMLDYLNDQPISPAKRGHQYVFLAPYPAKSLRGAGGYHAPGSGMVYIFFSRHGRRWLSHTAGHEYFHIYNDSALHFSADRNSWFVEAYTEGQATLRDMLDIGDRARRKNLFILEMADQFTLMQDQGSDVVRALRDAGLLVVPGRRIPMPDHPLAFSGRRELNNWSRLVRGRSFLLMHIMILIFESAHQYRSGFNNWFRRCFEKFPWQTDSPGIPTYDQFRQAGLDCAGAAAPVLEAFMSRYIERTDEFTLDDLMDWLRWADEENIFDTLFEIDPATSDG